MCRTPLDTSQFGIQATWSGYGARMAWGAGGVPHPSLILAIVLGALVASMVVITRQTAHATRVHNKASSSSSEPCESDAAADDAFVDAVRLSPGSIGCRPGGFERLDKLARLLSAAGAGGCSAYGFHGMMGVFSEPLASTPQGFQAYKYGSTKTRFMFNETCAHARATSRTLSQVCEIGFNAGHTALLFLEAAPAAHVLSFDLGEWPWAKKQAALLTRAYGVARFKAVFGSSEETVPAYARTRMPAKCDVAFIDGGKTEQLRMADLQNIRQVARPQALLLFDEVTTLACMRGEGERNSCGHAWGGATYAYHTASRERWLRIHSCTWPPGLEKDDGICAGHYADKRSNVTQLRLASK